MKRFFDRISSKARNVDEAPVLIVALGDSLTQGVMEHRRLDSASVYHRILQEHLETHFPATTFSTINAGVSGDTAAGGCKRLERDVIRHQPDLVILAFGSNDSVRGIDYLPQFESDMEAIIRRVRTETQADLLVLTPPFMATRQDGFLIHPEHRIYTEEIVRAQTSGVLCEFTNVVRKLCLRHELVMADIRAAWMRLAADGLDTDTWMVNGLNHPGPQGHRIAADLAFHALLTAGLNVRPLNEAGN